MPLPGHQYVLIAAMSTKEVTRPTYTATTLKIPARFATVNYITYSQQV